VKGLTCDVVNQIPCDPSAHKPLPWTDDDGNTHDTYLEPNGQEWVCLPISKDTDYDIVQGTKAPKKEEGWRSLLRIPARPGVLYKQPRQHQTGPRPLRRRSRQR
jgi:hypothetical protein